MSVSSKLPTITTEQYLTESAKLEMDIDVLASTIKQLKYKKSLIDLKIKNKLQNKAKPTIEENQCYP